MPDHINNIERTLIDNMRNGRYNNSNGIASGSAWASGTVNVFGQYPEPEDRKFPSIIIAQAANGLDEQFMGQAIQGSEDIGEMYDPKTERLVFSSSLYSKEVEDDTKS